MGDAAMAVRYRALVHDRALLHGVDRRGEHAVEGTEPFPGRCGREQPLALHDVEVDERSHAEGEKGWIVRQVGNRVLVIGDRARVASGSSSATGSGASSYGTTIPT